MDKVILKNIIVMSLLLGLILGFLAPVPVLGMLTLLAVLLLAAPLVMIYLIMDGKYDFTTTKDSIIVGSIIGFCANFTYAITYCILMAILSQAFNYSPNLFLSAMIINSPAWLLFSFIIFIGVLAATTNAFTGFGTYYTINFIRDMYELKHPQNSQNKDFNTRDYR